MKLSDAQPPPPPLHNLLMPHDRRYLDPSDERACPPNCPYRVWAEKHRPQPEGPRIPCGESCWADEGDDQCVCGEGTEQGHRRPPGWEWTSRPDTPDTEGGA